jgi:hypothetical protein
MIKEVKLASLLLIAGILLIAAHHMDLSPLNSAFGKTKAATKNVNFEIFDCVVQGNGTYEKSGRCPDSATEAFSDESAVSQKILPNAKPDQSEAPKPETNTTTSGADNREIMPKQSEAPKSETNTTRSGTDNRETLPEQSETPKVEFAHDKNLINDTGIQANNMNEEKYDFDQIHIVGPETPIKITEKSQQDIEPPTEISTPQDPFGASVR